MSGRERSTLGTVSNAGLILELLSDGPAYHPISELAQRSGLSLATLHRLLRSLVLAGLVEQHPETSRYGLGPQLLRLAARYHSRLPVLRVLSPYLVELRNATQATIEVSVLVAGDLVRLDRLDGVDTGIFREPQAIDRALSTAAGRVLLGRAEDSIWARAVNGQAAVGETERRQWASAAYLSLVSGDEFEIAVPVVNRREQTMAALSAVLPTPEGAGRAEVDGTEERVASQLLRVARAVGLAIAEG